jgi:hypothetical protein
MSFWIHAFCNQSTADITVADLRKGIEQRLELLTYLFCPEDEEDPEEVLQRLRIEDHSKEQGFQEFRLFYKKNRSSFIRVDRHDRAGIDELDEEVLADRSEPEILELRKKLELATDDVTFCLKSDDVEAMGFPIAIAAAALFVDRKGGVIQSGNYTWMTPSGNEVEVLCELEE